MSNLTQEKTGGPARSAGRLGRRTKSAEAFRTISEVASELDVPQHVLRFWESRFSQVRPLKRGGGRRYYRPEDIGLLRQIRGLLYRDGYTIKGVQKLLREGQVGPGTGAESASPGESAAGKDGAAENGASVGMLSERQRHEIMAAIDELNELKALLRSAGRP